ncbi:hypothetical protein ACFYR1_11180 [Streptomyces canus]|uniref:hypothetical protein n=1 Tax=Streptomyces canus TaxID=58343 RepID=UPI0036C21684
MPQLPTTAKAQSTQPSTATSNGGVQVPAARIAEQSITAFGLAEVVTDIETDEVTLCIASDAQLTDYRGASVSEAAALARQLREKADQIEALANEYAEKVVLPAFYREFRIELEEYNTASLFADAPELAAGFNAFCAHRPDGSFLVAVPAGQKPILRLAAIRELARDLLKRKEAQA